MNKQLCQLLEIAEKPTRKIIGIMSGTSLDGLDIAFCECSQNRVVVREFSTVSYAYELRKRIGNIQSKSVADLSEVCLLNTELAHYYSRLILEALDQWVIKAEAVDLIASHGQTIYHRPDDQLNSTLQIVDGDHIAQETGIITISDFRQKNTAAGGEGAPLAALMDERLFRHQDNNRMLLNLGGIANFTWLPSRSSRDEVLTSDTGPANTLINQAMHKYFDQPFDEEGKVAASGVVDSELLKYLLLEPYFRKEFPKTTGQEEFNIELVEKLMQGYRQEVSPENFVATLTKLTYKSIERAFDRITGEQKYELYVSGGGVHNPVIMKGLRENLTNAKMRPMEELGMRPDEKEAALMAFLANELIDGRRFQVGGCDIGLGKISLPD